MPGRKAVDRSCIIQARGIEGDSGPDAGASGVAVAVDGEANVDGDTEDGDVFAMANPL